ncbi:hypothetical protein HKX48_009112 [Thoreauomyces humboldtii]|nr:hypothetical protein HKX48_009112 [Thoreauomyces humboldtii]
MAQAKTKTPQDSQQLQLLPTSSSNVAPAEALSSIPFSSFRFPATPASDNDDDVRPPSTSVTTTNAYLSSTTDELTSPDSDTSRDTADSAGSPPDGDPALPRGLSASSGVTPGGTRPSSAYGSTGPLRQSGINAVFPASPLRPDRPSPYSSAPSSRRVSHNVRTSNYSQLLEGPYAASTNVASVYPSAESLGLYDENQVLKSPSRSVTSFGSSYPQSFISHSSRDSSRSYGQPASSDGIRTPLSSVLSHVADDDPYVAHMIELNAQSFRENQKGDSTSGTPASSASQPLVVVSGPGASRRSTRSSVNRVDALQPQREVLTPLVESPVPDGLSENVPEDPDFKVSKETLYRAGRCKQYFETRYSRVALIQASQSLRYNPLQVIRWRRAMWQRAVKAGADDQKRWKLRYYTWHVGNSELAEFYNQTIEAQDRQSNRPSMEEDADSSDSVDDGALGNLGRVMNSRWMRGLKRRQPVADEDTQQAAKVVRMATQDAIDRSTLLPDGSLAVPSSSRNSHLAPLRASEDSDAGEAPTLLKQFLGGGGSAVNASSSSSSVPLRGPIVEISLQPPISDESGTDQPKQSLETSASSLSASLSARPMESDGESVEDPSSLGPPVLGHGRKKSGFWDRIREKRSELVHTNSNPDLKGGSVDITRRRSIAGAVDQLTHRMRRSSSSGKMIEGQTKAEEGRTLGANMGTDLASTRRTRTPSPLKQMARSPSKNLDEEEEDEHVSFSRRTGMSEHSDHTAEIATNIPPNKPRSRTLGAHLRPDDYPSKARSNTGGPELLSVKDPRSATGARKSASLPVPDDPHGGEGESLASDSDDGDGRFRGRRLKTMMGKLGRRRQKGIDSRGAGDDAPGTPEIERAGRNAKPRDASKVSRRDSRSRSRNWGWDSSSSDGESRTSVRGGEKSDRRGRKKGKAGSMAGNSNGDLTETSDTPRTRNNIAKAHFYDLLQRRLIGNRLVTGSSSSLPHESQDGDDRLDVRSARRGRLPAVATRVATIGSDLTTSATSAEDDSDAPDRTPELAPGGNLNTAVGPLRTSVPRDPASAFTADEQLAYKGLMALTERLNALMPAAEEFKTSIQSHISIRDAVLAWNARPHDFKEGQHPGSPIPQRVLSAEMMAEPLSMGASVRSSMQGSVFQEPGPSTLTRSSSFESKIANALEAKVQAPPISTVEGLEQFMVRIQLSIQHLETHCQEVADRNASSHEQVSRMVADMDAVTKNVNEDLSRQLKTVEEAIQQIEGTPRAIGSLQEWYYQLIAYLLGVLGFTFWLWFQLWKIGRRCVSHARSVISYVSPGAVSAVESVGQAASKSLKS